MIWFFISPIAMWYLLKWHDRKWPGGSLAKMPAAAKIALCIVCPIATAFGVVESKPRPMTWCDLLLSSAQSPNATYDDLADYIRQCKQ